MFCGGVFAVSGSSGFFCWEGVAVSLPSIREAVDDFCLTCANGRWRGQDFLMRSRDEILARVDGCEYSTCHLFSVRPRSGRT